MRCVDLDELISAYVDGQTVPAQSELVEAHLRACPRCQAALRRHQQTRRLLHLLNDNTWTPPDMRLRVAHAYRQGQRRRHPIRVAGLAAVLAIVVLLAGVFAGQELAPRGAILVQAPAPHSVVTRHPAAAARAVASTHSRLVADWAACGRLSRAQQARCMGVSPHFLPTLLAEDLDLISMHSPSLTEPPVQVERSSPSITGSRTQKGGGTLKVTMSTRGGLQPI